MHIVLQYKYKIIKTYTFLSKIRFSFQSVIEFSLLKIFRQTFQFIKGRNQELYVTSGKSPGFYVSH